MIKTHDAGKTVTINDSERWKFRVLGQGETGGAFNRMRGQYCEKDAYGQVSWKILLLRSHQVWGPCGSSLFIKRRWATVIRGLNRCWMYLLLEGTMYIFWEPEAAKHLGGVRTCFIEFRDKAGCIRVGTSENLKISEYVWLTVSYNWDQVVGRWLDNNWGDW